MSGYFHRLWWCLLTVNVSGPHYFCLGAGNSLGTGKEAPHILPDTFGATAAFMCCVTRQPKSRDSLKMPFLSPAVATDISSVHLPLESSHTHMLANGSICKQAEKCAFYTPIDISTHGKTKHVSWC